MSESGKQPDEDSDIFTSCKGCSNLEDQLADLNRQVRMISESLIACKKMSKYRPGRRNGDFGVKTPIQSSPQTTVDKLQPPEETTLECSPESKNNIVNVSYMTMERNNFPYLQKSKSFISREEILSKKSSSDQKFEDDFMSSDASIRIGSPESCSKTSKVGLYKYEDVDPKRMIDVTQRELKILLKLAPTQALAISELSDVLFHYKKCRRCNKKIGPSLPWILNRIQKLVKYLTATTKKESYSWPNDLSYLRLSKKNLNSSKRRIGKLEKVDAAAVSDDKPGVQIVLEVKPEKSKKKYFDKTKYLKVVEDSVSSFSTLCLAESPADSLVQILKAKSNFRVFLNKKQEVLYLKEFGVSWKFFNFRPKPWICVPAKIFVPVGQAVTVLNARSQFFLKPIESYEVFVQKRNTDCLYKLVKQIGYYVEENETYKEVLDNPGITQSSDSLTKFWTNGSDLVQELLEEARGEKRMHVQKVKELESEVRGLKDLMMEVHKNQVELSRLLLEKGVYSQPMIKLTDPNMLEEENRIVSNATLVNVSGRRSTSLEALQLSLDELKRKCNIKNKMIVTLLKGLQSNVPKEWWEELAEYVFDESKAIEDFDPEKVTEFIRQTSLYLMSSEKASSLSQSTSKSKELATEEEPKTKGKKGEKLEDALKTLLFHGKESNASSRCEFTDVLEDGGLLTRCLVFPASGIPAPDATTESMLKKLENQITLLNAENDRLWHQVKELRQLLKTSVANITEDNFRKESEEQTEGIRKSSGKTINLTIQIGEKALRQNRDGAVVKILMADDTAAPSSSYPENSPILLAQSSEEVLEPLESIKPKFQIPCGTERGLQFCPKSDRRRSQNDLNHLDDALSTSVGHIKPIKVTTPRPSPHEIYHKKGDYQRQKPFIWDVYQAGPSSGAVRKHIDFGCLLQKPSVMELTENRNGGMFGTMANERELQTIPENDNADCNPSSSSFKGVGHGIQKLKKRVSSMNKDVNALKSKNDRVDKLLDKLADEAADNNKNFQKLDNDLSNFKN